MEIPRSFRHLCDRVRFPLDARSSDDTPLDPRLHDYLAQVRAESLRVTPSTAPAIGRMVQVVSERLSLEGTAEVYIRADSSINAFAPGLAHVDSPVVILNSGLVQLLTVPELMMPLGHELGHVGLGHSHGPGSWRGGELQRLSARSQQRYAEVSADRVGLLACRSTYVAANVMVKTASGLPSASLGIDIDAFISQMDRSPEEISREWELELSHPSLPFRLWAMLRFSHSDVYAQMTGQGGASVPIQALDEEIADRLQQMGDGRIARAQDEVLQRAIMWTGVSLMLRYEQDEGEAIGILEPFMGQDRAERAVRFAAQHGHDAVAIKSQTALAALEDAGPDARERFDIAVRGITGQFDGVDTSGHGPLGGKPHDES